MRVNRNEVGSNRHGWLLINTGGRKLSKSRLLRKSTKAMQEWLTVFTTLPQELYLPDLSLPNEDWNKYD